MSLTWFCAWTALCLSHSGSAFVWPEKLSEVAAYQDPLHSHSYEVQMPLWADHADKTRKIYLPEGKQLEFSSDEPWKIPKEGMAIKEFSREGKKLETRFILRKNNGYDFMTYVWNESQTEAYRTTEGLEISSQSDLPPWKVPSVLECRSCHAAPNPLLAVRTLQWKADLLENWKNKNLISDMPLDQSQLIRLSSEFDTTHSTARQARSYLFANCAHCHSIDGNAPGGMDMRFMIRTSDMQIANIPPSEGNLGIQDVFRVKPYKKEKSVLWIRMNRLDEFRMPKIGSRSVHDLGADLIGRWIDEGAKDVRDLAQ